MATNTRVLGANVNGTVYTSNLNNALEAIDTCHSGIVAPTNEVSNGKLWLDTSTTPAILKVYNNATWAVVHSGTVDINDGNIDGTVIGATTPAAVTTSSLVATTGTITTAVLAGDTFNAANRIVGESTTGAIRATYGGTANAIALTTGLGETVPLLGVRYAFRATSNNTGATTMSFNGGTPIACVTPSGNTANPLPSSFVRVTCLTQCWYNGTNMVLDREILENSNANGEFTQWPDGTMVCTEQFQLATIGVGVTQLSDTWTFPAAFIANPHLAGTPTNGGFTPALSEITGIFYNSISTTSISVIVRRIVNATDFVLGDTLDTRLLAMGRWY
jgi:hypothetical protein